MVNLCQVQKVLEEAAKHKAFFNDPDCSVLHIPSQTIHPALKYILLRCEGQYMRQWVLWGFFSRFFFWGGNRGFCFSLFFLPSHIVTLLYSTVKKGIRLTHPGEINSSLKRLSQRIPFLPLRDGADVDS